MGVASGPGNFSGEVGNYEDHTDSTTVSSTVTVGKETFSFLI